MKDIARAAARGAVGATAMTGMRTLADHVLYGLVLSEGRRPPRG
ncbi:MAG TPA: hypothetical protein VK304_02785 [Thermoleophilaceae bacterium]|nr:hypothetical protein [Thermoleophilaceae bacterium]